MIPKQRRSWKDILNTNTVFKPWKQNKTGCRILLSGMSWAHSWDTKDRARILPLSLEMHRKTDFSWASQVKVYLISNSLNLVSEIRNYTSFSARNLNQLRDRQKKWRHQADGDKSGSFIAMWKTYLRWAATGTWNYRNLLTKSRTALLLETLESLRSRCQQTQRLARPLLPVCRATFLLCPHHVQRALVSPWKDTSPITGSLSSWHQ